MNKLKTIYVIIAILFVGYVGLTAQKDTTNKNAKPFSGWESAFKNTPFVFKVFTESVSQDSNFASLGDRISLKVFGLNNLYRDTTKDLYKLVLYLDNVKIWGCYPQYIDTASKIVQFKLIRLTGDDELSQKNNKAWSEILGHPNSFTRNVTVSLGFEDGLPFHTSINRRTFHGKHPAYSFNLVQIKVERFWICLGLLVIFLVVFYFFGLESELLRMNTTKPVKPQRRPYSLATTQLAFWFVLVVASLLFLWLMTGDFIPLSPSVLGILAISTVTGISGNGVDAYNQKKSPAILISKGFFRDIFGDADGINFHRFQMIVWNFLFGLFFLYKVWYGLSIPDIDSSMLVLMGITSGTYIGFKVPEKK